MRAYELKFKHPKNIVETLQLQHLPSLSLKD